MPLSGFAGECLWGAASFPLQGGPYLSALLTGPLASPPTATLSGVFLTRPHSPFPFLSSLPFLLSIPDSSIPTLAEIKAMIPDEDKKGGKRKRKSGGGS